ncbi:MAG: hypothetical protein U5J63_14250 [Fodinibius sp.]|nr:hypothetical protein [Fodinibius sp.]
MERRKMEFTLSLKAKLILGGIIVLFGGPILYAAVLQFQSQHLLMGALMVLLFVLFVLVLLVATGYKITITDQSLRRQSLFGATEIAFEQVNNLHLGSSWTNFYVAGNGTKIFVTSDFEQYHDIIRQVIQQLKRQQSLDTIDLTGNQQSVERYLPD